MSSKGDFGAATFEALTEDELGAASGGCGCGIRVVQANFGVVGAYPAPMMAYASRAYTPYGYGGGGYGYAAGGYGVGGYGYSYGYRYGMGRAI